MNEAWESLYILKKVDKKLISEQILIAPRMGRCAVNPMVPQEDLPRFMRKNKQIRVAILPKMKKPGF